MIAVPVGTSQAGVVTRDLNKDGRPDLAIVSSATNDLIVLLQNPATANGFKMSVTQRLGGTPTALIAADFDLNGVLDLAITLSPGGSGTLAVLNGQVDNGALSYTQASPVSTGRGPQGLAGADFSRDGKLDVVVADTNDSTLSFVLNEGGTVRRLL